MTADKKIYGSGIFLAIVVNIFSWQFPFFWDTILTSTITQHFFEHGFQGFITPAEFDAGHPPLFYVYVTFFFNLFGKNLLSAHLSILPLTILGIVSFIQLMQHFSFDKRQQFTGVLLFFTVPAVITQYTLVSYDAVLLSLYLAALVAYFKGKRVIFAFLLFGMLGITLRGLFCLAALSVTLYFLEKRHLKNWLKWNLFLVPALLLTVCWYGYHYAQTGWFFATNAAGWSEQRGFVNASGLFKNGISVARCFFDLGMVIVSFLSFFYVLQKRKLDNYTLIWLLPAVVFSVSFLPFTNPINHRYFLIVYILMLLPVIRFLSERKKVYTGLTMVILLLGHLQIYPVPISNGWDCTLAHTSYCYLRNDLQNKIINNRISDKSQIGAVFPINASLYQTNMELDTFKLINVNGKSIDSIPLILYSNIGNDFSDEQIEQLKKWDTIYQSKKGLVQLILLANPKFLFD